MILNKKRLINLYTDWYRKYGTGRNKQDIRFGQYISNAFDLKGLNYDPFYEESPVAVYSELIMKL